MSGHVWSSKGGTINNGHAWVRISDSYYDTTWDVGKTDGFVWYGLPKDFIDARNTDTYPKSLSENQYDTYYRAQLLSLAKKYQWQGYVLLVPYELMNSLGITPETVLSDDEFTTKLKMVVTKYVEATDGKFTFSENGKIYRIVERGGTLTPSFNDFMSWNPHYGDIGLQALIHTPNEMYTLTTGGFDVVQVTP